MRALRRPRLKTWPLPGGLHHSDWMRNDPLEHQNGAAPLSTVRIRL